MSTLERRLKHLVRQAKGVPRGSDIGDLAAVYKALGLAPSEAMSTGAVASALYERIAKDLAWSDRKSAVRLADLERHLVLRFLADDAPFLECICLLSNLTEASRMASWLAPPLSETARWTSALSAARDYHRVHSQPLTQAPYLNPRHRSIAEAVKRLRQAGIRVQIQDGKARIEEGERRRLVGILESSIADLGGIEFATFLFDRMTGWYDPEQQRHHAVRRLSTTGTHDGMPVTPVGYLLNLSAKFTSRAPNMERASREGADTTVQLAGAFVDCFDLRPFSSFDGLFKDHDTLLPFLQEVVLYDAAYTLVQTRIADVPAILGGLFDWVVPAKLLGSGWTVAQFVDVTSAIAAEAAHLRGPGIFSKIQLSKRTGANVPPEALEAVLDACSHAPDEVNARYTLPWEQAKATRWKKPLIKIESGYLMLDPAWCAPAFYEVLATELRLFDKLNVDHEVGTALERLVKGELRRRGVQFSCGTYTAADGTDGECDVIVETESTIILIEIKKKALRPVAKGGDPIALLADLSESLFSAQEQAAGHELTLYKDGKLVLTDGGAIHTVVRGDRDVERVALTQLDYGSPQDRGVLSQVLHLLAGASIHSADPAAQKPLAKLEFRGQALRKRHDELDNHRTVNDHNQFFHCWFLSLGHLLVMLDHVDSNEIFWRELRQTRHLSVGSRDFYYEYACARRIRAT